jgi:prepilin-type N-terminal cleavage/methylation domain-containing protein
MIEGASMKRRLRMDGAVWAADSAGYSLPELLVVIFLIGMFVLFTGPALSRAYKSYQVSSAANELAAHIRALRYNAVASRTSFTLNIDNPSPGHYSYVNTKGQQIVMTLPVNAAWETGTASSITFNNNGATGAAGNTIFKLIGVITETQGDRYTITVTPSGTVSSTYSTYTP